MTRTPLKDGYTLGVEATLAQKERLLNDAVRFLFLVGPALSPVVGGELGMMEPTTDLKGAILLNDHAKVTLIPASETIVLEGIGTMHRLEIVAIEGKLNKEQIVQIVATIAAIKSVRGHRPDPLVDGLDLLGRSEVMIGA